MNTAVINVKVDPGLKDEAQKVANDLGFGLSSLVKGFLKSLVRTRTVTFSSLSEEPNDYTLKILKESLNDYKKGRFISFDSPSKAVEFLDKMIVDDKKN